MLPFFLSDVDECNDGGHDCHSKATCKKKPLGTLHAIAKTDTEEMDATVKVEIS